MNKSLKFFGGVLLIAGADMVFPAGVPSLTQVDFDQHNATLRARLATLRPTLPEEALEIKRLEMRILAQNRLEEITAGIEIAAYGDMPRTSLGLSRGTPLRM
jgi:coenzyme F420-reducing hydrogenase delta subunit